MNANENRGNERASRATGRAPCVQMFGLFLLIVLCSGVLSAEGLESRDSRFVAERPDAAGGPTLVTLFIHMFDIDEIDDVKQRFSVDLFFASSWRDPRLAVPDGERSGGRMRKLPMSDIWTPRGLIVNDRGTSLQLPQVVEVDDDGNVTYQQRLSGELATDLRYENFPYDRQRLPIDVISYAHSPDELQFSLDSTISGDAGSFSEEGWRLTLVEPEFGEFLVPAIGISRPRVTFYIEAERNWRYYLLTMFLPMSLIVFMSWTAFWLQPEIVPPRVAISTASIFSLIAFGFTIRVSLPPISYLTRADYFVMGCTLMVFLSLAVAVIGSRWASSDRQQQALRLNAIARWAYVGLYCVVAVTTLAI